jgi:hypothetical protein
MAFFDNGKKAADNVAVPNRTPGPKFGGSKDGRAENDGQHRTTGGTDRANNSGQRGRIVPGSKSPQDAWNSEENMEVPVTDRDADWSASEADEKE